MIGKRKMIRKVKKVLLKVLTTCLVVSSMSLDGMTVNAEEGSAEVGNAVPITNFEAKMSDSLTLSNVGGDNLMLLGAFAPEDEFVYGADVTFANLDEQQSVALVFGIRNDDLSDGNAMKANIHKRIDWNVPARVWGYGTDELLCPGEKGAANTFFEENNVDMTKTFHMEVKVEKNPEGKYVLTYSVTNVNGEKVQVATATLKDEYAGGKFGLMTYGSEVVFTNITVEGKTHGVQKYGCLETLENAYKIHGVNGNAHVVSDVCMENGKSFSYEADINLASGASNAALAFGIADKENPAASWISAEFNTKSGEASVFVDGGAGVGSASLEDKLDVAKTIHAKLKVFASGKVTYTLYNTDTPENSVVVSGRLNNYQGGYLGLVSSNSTIQFANVNYAYITEEDDGEDSEQTPVGVYNNNIGDLTYAGGTWMVTENGLRSNAIGKGDCFAFSSVSASDFVYSTDVTFEHNEGAAALMFRSNGSTDNKESYVVNIDVSSHKCKMWRWQKNDALHLIDEKAIPATEDEKYTLKVVAYDSWILYYVNDQLIASTGDYVLQPNNKGQNTVIKDGVFGMLNWNSKVTYQNTYYKELGGSFNPILTDIYVTSSTGDVEGKTQFTPTEPITLQYVKNNASTVDINVTKVSDSAVVEIKDANGKTYADGKNIPVNTGSNYITVTSTVTAEDGTTASVTYRVNVHRFKEDIVYYNEENRGQFHYSVKEGWANDPNGMVYYNGKYHLFYQFYDDIKWGPMHWAHATSTDLIHWEEQPIAFYPDANGAMFSGCIVVDENNTSGLFEGDKGGLVALITADGNGQRVKLAYSVDEGKTWTKVDEIAADWTDDPLRDGAFRDPKVFRWEGKWFMVIAGGPLRIYSSDNLREWKCETPYKDLHTECPDMYPIQASDGQLKWVLSRGGRFYKVGDFKEVDGNWQFIPDSAYASTDGVMNFGRDSYAAMTYYIQDFGTASNPTLPKLIEINWMNTWDDYCNAVAQKAGQDFNGTFNLNLELGLIKDGDTYVLTQTPVEQYTQLRNTETVKEWKEVTVGEDNDLLKDFCGDTYEIVAKFYPQEGTKKVGFRIRTGEAEETLVVYDISAQKMLIDRSKSGVVISDKFKEITSQNMTLNSDGSVDMHIYVDNCSVEVFAKDYTVCGANQIFPSPFSLGAEVFVEGADAKADITIYDLESIWTNKVEITEPYMIGTTVSTKQMMYVNDTVKLNVYVLPADADQDILWEIKEGENIVDVQADGTVTAKKVGTAVVVAVSKAKPSITKEFTIEVCVNNFKTNISEFVNLGGNWIVNKDTLSVSNVGQNDFYMTAEKIAGDFVFETDIRFTKGLINIFLASENINPSEGSRKAYTIQFNDSRDIRLFPFTQDDIKRVQMPSAINDGDFHHLKVVKIGKKMDVFVDENKCLDVTISDDFATEVYLGLGLWDGALDVKNYYVYPMQDSKYLKQDSVATETATLIEEMIDTTYKNQFSGMQTYMMDIKLLKYLPDSSTMEEIHTESCTVVLPYPSDVNKDNYTNYDFVVLHLLEANGQKTPELLSFNATEEGLQVTTTFSSFAVGFKVKTTDDSNGGGTGTGTPGGGTGTGTPGGGTGTGTPEGGTGTGTPEGGTGTGTPEGGTGTGTPGSTEGGDNNNKPSSGNKDANKNKDTASSPKTGDAGNAHVWAILAVVASIIVAGATKFYFFKKEKQNTV